MVLNTLRFGEINIADEKILTFPAGIPPFDDSTRYTLITTEETEPFMWLQSLDEPDLALAVVNPFRLFPDYSPAVSDEVLAEIGNPAHEDILVLTISVVSKDYEDMFTNLVSPVLINPHTNQCRQVIMENTPYLLRQPIFEEVQRLVLEGGEV